MCSYREGNNVKKFKFKKIGIETTKQEAIKVDVNLKTNINNIHYDVTDRFNLNPVAIAEGNYLATNCLKV